MYQLLRIYTKEDMIVRNYSPSEMPLSKCIELSKKTTNFMYAVAINDTVMKRKTGLHASLIMQERVTPDTTTWQQFVNQITEEWVEGYKIDLFGLVPGTDEPKYPWECYYPFTYIGLKPHYCSIDSRNIRDNRNLKYDLPDLVISKEKDHPVVLKAEKYKLPNFKNCIAVTNGLCTRTLFDKDNDELYIINGNRYLFDTTKEDSGEVALYDLSNLGNVNQYPLNTLTIKYQNLSQTPDSNVMWNVILPDNVSFTTHTVLLVLSGGIFFPTEYIKLSDKVLGFTPSTLPLEKLYQVSYKVSEAHPHVFQNDNTVTDYLRNLATNKSNADAFIITIDNPDVYCYMSTVSRQSYQYMAVSKRIGNTIRRKSTHQLLPFTYLDLATKDVAFVRGRSPLIDVCDNTKNSKTVTATKMYKPTDSYQTNPLEFHFGYQDPWKDDYLYPFKDLRLSEYILIDLVSGKIK